MRYKLLVTDLDDEPACGSDAISRACEEAWIGAAGYRRADGSRQQRALAFQGTVVTPDGEAISEVFVVDLPDADAPAGGLDTPASGPLAGTPTTSIGGAMSRVLARVQPISIAPLPVFFSRTAAAVLYVGSVATSALIGAPPSGRGAHRG